MARQLQDLLQRIPQVGAGLRGGREGGNARRGRHAGQPVHAFDAAGLVLRHSALPPAHANTLAPLRSCTATPWQQVTAELQKLEAKRASGAEGSAPLRGELRRLEGAGAEAQRRAAAKQALLEQIERELASLEVCGWA